MTTTWSSRESTHSLRTQEARLSCKLESSLLWPSSQKGLSQKWRLKRINYSKSSNANSKKNCLPRRSTWRNYNDKWSSIRRREDRIQSQQQVWRESSNMAHRSIKWNTSQHPEDEAEWELEREGTARFCLKKCKESEQSCSSERISQWLLKINKVI